MPDFTVTLIHRAIVCGSITVEAEDFDAARSAALSRADEASWPVDETGSVVRPSDQQAAVVADYARNDTTREEVYFDEALPPSTAPPAPSDAPALESYTLMHPHDPYDEAMSLIFNHTAGEAVPWQVQVMCNGSLHAADYFATEMDALRWATREATTIAAVKLHEEAEREDAPADPFKAEMLAALKSVWAFATTMAERHGMNGDDTMTDADHAAWQDAAGKASAAMACAEGRA